MNVQVVNQFLAATSTVLRDYFNIAVTASGQPRLVKSGALLDPVTVRLGLTGDLEGCFILGYGKDTALSVARGMLGNPDYPDFDDLCISALAELGNMIAGTAATGLAGQGLIFNLMPPAVLRNGQAVLDNQVPAAIQMPVETSAGFINVGLGLMPGGTKEG
jgi:chemotaxis protein CheX